MLKGWLQAKPGRIVKDFCELVHQCAENLNDSINIWTTEKAHNLYGRGSFSMPRSAAAQLILGKQRNALMEIVARYLESARDDYLPGESLSDFITCILVVHKMHDMHRLGREATATALSRALGTPRTTLLGKLARLKKRGIIEQNGSRFMLSPAYLNQPHILLGFKRRLRALRGGTEKLSETDN